jgi:hypothetical protein
LNNASADGGFPPLGQHLALPERKCSEDGPHVQGQCQQRTFFQQ